VSRVERELADYEQERQKLDNPDDFPQFAYGLVLICPICGRVSPPVEKRGEAWEVWKHHRQQFHPRTADLRPEEGSHHPPPFPPTLI
jgi:hypothetical protein